MLEFDGLVREEVTVGGLFDRQSLGWSVIGCLLSLKDWISCEPKENL